MVRQVNEDACLDRPGVGLWAVADGMGGHSAGDVASTMIVDALAEVPRHASLSDMVEDVERRLLQVNLRLREIAAKQEAHTIGSTVASLCAMGHHAICLWAGDSRIYRYRDDTLEMMTQDHALVEELVERGVLSREDAAHHPQGNLVTRAVGATDSLFLDMEIFELRDGDTFVLCSDGLDKEVSAEDLARTIATTSADQLSDRLIELALARGARDNVTVVAVRVSGESENESTVPDFNGASDDDEITVPGLAGGRTPAGEEER